MITASNIIAVGSFIVAAFAFIFAFFKWVVPMIFKPYSNQIEENEEDIKKIKDQIDIIQKKLVELDAKEGKNSGAIDRNSDRIGRMDIRISDADEKSSRNSSMQQKTDSRLDQFSKEKSTLFKITDEIRKTVSDLSVVVGKIEGKI